MLARENTVVMFTYLPFFSEASHAIADMPVVLLTPVFTLTILVFVAGYQAFMFVWMYTAATPILDSAGVVTYTQDLFIFWMQFYFYFGEKYV